MHDILAEIEVETDDGRHVRFVIPIGELHEHVVDALHDAGKRWMDATLEIHEFLAKAEPEAATLAITGDVVSRAIEKIAVKAILFLALFRIPVIDAVTRKVIVRTEDVRDFKPFFSEGLRQHIYLSRDSFLNGIRLRVDQEMLLDVLFHLQEEHIDVDWFLHEVICLGILQEIRDVDDVHDALWPLLHILIFHIFDDGRNGGTMKVWQVFVDDDNERMRIHLLK